MSEARTTDDHREMRLLAGDARHPQSPTSSETRPHVTQPSRDWFRQTTWGDAEQREFLARLTRARRKGQYLYLQGLTLTKTGDSGTIAAGIALLERMIAEDPEPIYLSNAHLARAEALVRLGRAYDAVAAFRTALDTRRALPNIINYAYLEFAWTIARLGMRERFDEVIAVLREFEQPSDLAFPSNAYRYFGALALIAADRGEQVHAREHATAALDAIARERGPFARHPDFGLVDPAEVDPEAHRRLSSLAAG